MLSLKYKILFQVKVVLQDYSEALLNDIEVIPAGDTQKIIDNYRLKLITREDTFYVFSEIVTTNKNETRITLPADLKFEFNFKFRNTKFKDFYSNLSKYNLETGALLFDNVNGVKSGTDLFLTSQYKTYSNTKTYEKGYLVKQGTSLFMAVDHNDAGSPKDTTNSAFWKSVGNKQYASQENLADRSTLANIEKNEFARVTIYNQGVSADFAITAPVDISLPEDVAAGRTLMGTLPESKTFIIQFKNYKIS